MAGGRTPADGKRLGEQMSKKISGLFALLAFLGLSLFLINCGSSSSRPAGVLYVLSQGENNVGSFAIDLGSGRLSLINNTASTCPTLTQTPPVPCGFPESIILDPSGSVAFVLDQGDPTHVDAQRIPNPIAPMVYAYNVKSDGSLTATGTPVKVGASIDNDPLTADTATVMTRDSSGNFLFVISEGADSPPNGCAAPQPPANGCPAISVFSVQSGSANLTPVVGSPFILGRVPTSLTTGIGPNGTLLYVTSNKDFAGINDNQVSAFNVDASGVVTPQTNPPYATGSVPTAVLAVQTTPTGGSGGLFVYVANSGSGSGANSVSIFQVCTQLNATCTAQDVTATNNTLIPVGNPVSVGLSPVAMTVDPTNNFLYVVNHGSSTLSAFRINPTTGELSALNPSSVSTGSSPVAITMHSSGKFLYVSNNASSNISGFDVSTTNGALSNATNVTSSAQPAGLVAR
jgi:hypothetical protein